MAVEIPNVRRDILALPVVVLVAFSLLIEAIAVLLAHPELRAAGAR